MLLIKKTGILAPLYSFMGWIMNTIYNMLNSLGIANIGVAIIIFTIVVRLLMFPLTLKSTKSSKIQKYLQPEFNKITKKYKGKKDQQSMMKQQAEVRELQQKYGIKMTSGCLTSLIQLPIFFSLYWVIRNIPSYVTKIHTLFEPIAAQIKEAVSYDSFKEFLNNSRIIVENGSLTKSTYGTGEGIIDSLYKFTSSAWDNFSDTVLNLSSQQGNISKIQNANSFFGINLAEAPGFKISIALIIPIAALIFQYLSTMSMQKQQVATDASQEATMQTMNKFMKIMPIFSFIICMTVSAGVGIYWAVGAAISWLTTVATNAYYNKVDMEKIIEKAMAKAEIKNAKRKASGKKTFMERLTENAAAQQEAREKNANMEKFGGARLKNYTSTTSTQSKDNVKYRQGSIAAKANAMRQYNDKESK